MDTIAANNLMNRIRDGDDKALKEFYEIYGRKIFVTAYYMTQNYHDAQDVQSIVLGKFWFDRFKYIDNLGGLVYTVTSRTALNYIRDNKKHRRSLSYGEEVDRKAVTFEFTEQDLAVNDVLDMLSEKEREVVLRHVLFGDTFREISKDMKIPRTTAQIAHLRALKKLQDRCVKIYPQGDTNE